MRILHLCLACFYIDGYNYQENVLPRINKEDGHEVRIIASTETFVDNQNLGYVEPSEYVTEYGVPIKRLPYVTVGTHFTTIKFRKYPHLYEEIAAFAPDVIMSHDIAFWSVLDVIRYKKEHPNVKFYADTHTDEKNSGRNWISMHVLHRLFYRYLHQRALPYLEKFFYVTAERKIFAQKHYGMPESILEFYPLGGNIFSENEYDEKRRTYREHLGVTGEETVFVHSGKMDTLKRTEELILAFSSVRDLKAKLVIIGSMTQEREPVLMPLIQQDPRIVFLGWRPSEELLNYLCACDMYLQPGSQSATLENSLCCKCAVMSYPHEAYTSEYGASGIMWCETQQDMQKIFKDVAEKKIDFHSLSEQALNFAEEVLNYRKLAGRLYR